MPRAFAAIIALHLLLLERAAPWVIHPVFAVILGCLVHQSGSRPCAASSVWRLLLKYGHSAHRCLADAIRCPQCEQAVLLPKRFSPCCLDGAATAPALQCVRACLCSDESWLFHFFQRGSESTSTSTSAQPSASWRVLRTLPRQQTFAIARQTCWPCSMQA